MVAKLKELYGRFGYGFVVSFLIVALTLFFSYTTNVFINNKISNDFINTSVDLVHSIEDRLEIYSNISRAGVGLYSSSVFIDREEWSTFFDSQDILEKYPSVIAIGLSNVVKFDNKESYIKKINDDGFKGFKIYPDVDKDEYIVVNYLAPYEGNESAFGFDLSSESNRREALEKARDTNSFSLTAPVILVQGTENFSFLGTLPLYRNGSDYSTLELRRENIKGYVSTVFNVDLMLDDIDRNSQEKLGIHFVLSDVESGIEFFNGGHDVYEEGNGGMKFSDVKYSGTIDTGSRVWKMESHPNKLFMDQYRNELFMPKLVLIAGFLLAILIFSFFALLDRSRSSAQKLANKMTANYKMEKEKVESQKTQVEEALEKTKESKRKVEDKVRQIEEINETMVGREMKMIELKNKIKELEGE